MSAKLADESVIKERKGKAKGKQKMVESKVWMGTSGRNLEQVN